MTTQSLKAIPNYVDQLADDAGCPQEDLTSQPRWRTKWNGGNESDESEKTSRFD